MEKLQYALSKDTAQVYRFNGDGNSTWAEITIMAHPLSKYGRISIASDFGNWTNFWVAFGDNFRAFLGSLDMHYAAGKFGTDKFFDANATIEGFKKRAEEVHTTKSAQYRNIMETITSMSRSCRTKEDFVVFLYGEGKPIFRMYDGAPELVLSIDPLFVRFWENVWPELIKAFDQEAEEAANVYDGYLTLPFLENEANRGKIFATGVVNMPSLHSEPVRWIGKVGDGYHDWAIYYDREKQTPDFIKMHGMKVTTEAVIRKLVPCTDEAYKHYRR